MREKLLENDYQNSDNRLDKKEYSIFGRRQSLTKQDMIKQKTKQLRIVIIINWISIVIAVIYSISLFSKLIVFGILSLGFVWLEIWLVREISRFNNTARIFQIFVSIIGFSGSIFSFNLSSLIILGFIIYALKFHKPTVNLFTNDYSSAYV